MTLRPDLEFRLKILDREGEPSSTDVSPHRTFLLIACVFVFVAGALALNDALLYTPDSARYLTWAKSLSQGNGYSDLTSPEPSRYVVHAPLYPVLLIPSAWIGSGSVVAAKATNILLAVLLLMMVFRWVSEAVDRTSALLVVLFLSIHSLLLIYATQVLSEVPFVLAAVIAFRELDRLQKETGRHALADMAGLILALGAGMFLREVGVTLIIATLIYLAVRGEWRRVFWIGAASAVIYALWITRNEIIVAGVEQPPLRNSRLFVSHLYTPESSSLFAEFAARISANAKVYAEHVATLIFAPDFVRQSHRLVAPTAPVVSWVVTAMPFLGPFYLLLTLVGVGAGIHFGWSRVPVVRLITCVLVVYALPILLYPINDVRFLFLPAVLILVLMSVGLKETVRRFPIADRIGRSGYLSACLVVLCAVPSVSWDAAYVINNWRYANDATRFVADPQTPEFYKKRMREAAAWISDRSDVGGNVLTRWKETGLWMPERSVVDVDPQLTPDNFDDLVRDYDVRYVVTVTQRNGIRENEQQLQYSSRFQGRTVHRAGNVEVVELVPRSGDPIQSIGAVDSVALFRAGLHELRRGDPARAESLFMRAQERLGKGGAINFQLAVAMELSGHMEEAMTVFNSFRSVPQAGSLIQQSWYHQEIIDRLHMARSTTDPVERANKYYVVAINYWELGLRGPAFRMLDSALAAQPDFFPAAIFAVIFSYQDGSLQTAARRLNHARLLEPGNVLVKTMTGVLECDRRLMGARSTADTISILHEKALAFLAAGMRDDAIDVWRGIITCDGSNVQALSSLTKVYDAKRRYGPARQCARRWLAAAPTDSAAQRFLEALEQRWR